MIKNGNLIMVTSALAGEGKSFCTVNLAMSIAMEMDRTVLLVDADVARPTVPKILGLGTEIGLLDILQDEKLDLADVLIKTNIEKADSSYSRKATFAFNRVTGKPEHGRFTEGIGGALCRSGRHF